MEIYKTEETRCIRCGKPFSCCRCRMGDPYKETFDVSFQCYTCELHFDKDTGAFKNNEENGHTHNNHSTLFTTKLFEEVLYIMCQNLISLMKYRDAVENKSTEITGNETIHDYILSRLENIENCWCSLFLNGKISVEEYKEFSCEHETLLTLLNIGNWENVGYFNKYIEWIKNSPLFKNNDVKIL